MVCIVGDLGFPKFPVEFNHATQIKNFQPLPMLERTELNEEVPSDRVSATLISRSHDVAGISPAGFMLFAVKSSTAQIL